LAEAKQRRKIGLLRELQSGKGFGATRSKIESRRSTTKLAGDLRALQIEEVTFQFRYAKTMNSCFDLPLDDW